MEKMILFIGTHVAKQVRSGSMTQVQVGTVGSVPYTVYKCKRTSICVEHLVYGIIKERYALDRLIKS